MKRINIIGLTGQSGAGKSTVAKLFTDKGILVVSADKIVSELYQKDSVCLNVLSANFGKDIINSDGTLNRQKLAQKAFVTKENTSLLNSLIHPFVLSKFLAIIKDASKNSNNNIAVFDAPQLFESNADAFCKAVIAVTASENIRLNRICSRDNISKECAKLRMNAQLDELFFRNNCDFIIENNNDKEMLKNKFNSIFESVVSNN